MIRRIPHTLRSTGLDLDGGSFPVDRHQEIQFAAPDAQIAILDDSAPPLQEVDCYRFTEPAETSPAQRAEVGSSSSILTSRKVITLTLFTNLAGRYMSHTHASFNSNSK